MSSQHNYAHLFSQFAQLVIFQWSDQVHAQTVSDFLLQYNNRLFCFVSELMDLLLTGEDQSQADQPNNLAEGHPM